MKDSPLNSAQGEPATPESPPPDTRQVVKHSGEPSPIIDLSTLGPDKKALRRKRRSEFINDLKAKVEYSSLKDVALRQYIYLTDEQLKANGLSDAQIRKVRSWEEPEKRAAFALSASARFVTSMLRRDTEKGKTGINVEKLIIKLPERGASELPEPITIEAEVVK